MRRKVMVGIPLSWTEVPRDFFVSFLGIAQDNKNIDLEVQINTICYLDRMRNDFVEKFLASDSQYLLMLDADQTYPADTVSRLCDHVDSGKAVVGGLTNHRHNGHPLMYHFDDEKHGFRQIEMDMEGKGLVKVDAMGMGGVMFSRKAFDGMKVPYFMTGWTDKGAYVGEDIYYFTMARENKIDVWCDTDLKFGHLKQIVI